MVTVAMIRDIHVIAAECHAIPRSTVALARLTNTGARFIATATLVIT